MRLLALITVLSALMAAPAHAIEAHGAQYAMPRLSTPIDCAPEKTCFIQNYVDLDPGPGMRDYKCGRAVYNAHKGVDFRLITDVDMRRGVRVLAAAPGRVTGARDGMADRRISKNGPGPELKGRECGNGVVVQHGGGLVTQYCHMRRGSIQVRKGDKIRRGQMLGLVGLSGKTAFPHLHLSVRRDRKIIDPFTGRMPGSECGPANARPLWTEAVLKAFPYKKGSILKSGFVQERVTYHKLRLGVQYPEPLSPDAPVIGLYGWVMNINGGDHLRIRITGPRGEIITHVGKPVPRHKAVYFEFAGRKRPEGGWPRGTYVGTAAIMRGEKVISERRHRFEIR